MKKPIIIFALITVLAVGMTVYGWIFVNGQIGEAVLTEDTLMGNREAAAGLTVGFRVDSADDLHWMNRFNYSTGETKSVFKRGEMSRKDEPNIYDDMRFTGWSTAPFFTRLENEMPEGLQDKKIQAFYSGIQKQVMESGSVKTGKIKVKDYLDYYPVSFSISVLEPKNITRRMH